ncbi:MAG: hypothetical protein HY200_10130 [Nitrospirae bacterium]|nr:hypothetical protein [Nitrospirota bacterium]
MEISKTEKKLRETKFFLDNLIAVHRHPTEAHPEAFEHYLSAFLSAGRSVTIYLQNEAKKEYDEFFPVFEKSLSPQERSLCQEIINQRNNETKSSGAEFEKKDRTVHSPIGPEYDVIPAPALFSIDPNLGFFISINIPQYFFKIDGSHPSELIQAFQQYVAILERWLKEFKEKYSVKDV